MKKPTEIDDAELKPDTGMIAVLDVKTFENKKGYKYADDLIKEHEAADESPDISGLEYDDDQVHEFEGSELKNLINTIMAMKKLQKKSSVTIKKYEDDQVGISLTQEVDTDTITSEIKIRFGKSNMPDVDPVHQSMYSLEYLDNLRKLIKAGNIDKVRFGIGTDYPYKAVFYRGGEYAGMYVVAPRIEED